MTAKDYPITQGYGYDPNYQGNAQHWHTGVDYGAPEGAPIVVNGVQIGITGHTGKVYDQDGKNTVKAAHVHVGRYFNGETNPGAGGWTLSNPKVTEIGYDASNGNYVALVDSAGVRWVYLHMQVKSTNVKVGDYLDQLPKYEGEDMPSTVGDVEIDQMSWAYFGYGSPSDSQFTKDNMDRESNEFERFMFAHPVAQAYRKQVSQWRSKAESSGNPSVQVDGVPYVPKK